MCKPKNEGGMGFKDPSIFNDAMLSKFSLALLNGDNSLFYRVFKARFLPNDTILEAKESLSASYVWKCKLKRKGLDYQRCTLESR